MNSLKVPEVFARLRVDGDDGVREEVVAGTITSPVVPSRTRNGHVKDAALFVERHVPRPHVHARSIAPPAIEPGVVPELTWQRHSVKVPHVCTRPDVERAGMTGRAACHVTRGRTEDRDVPINRRDAVPGHADLNDAISPEAGDG